MKRQCRKQEDRLRRLRSRATEVVADRPSKAKREYSDRLTYDQKVQETLRDVYERCAKARRDFIRDVDEAVAVAKDKEKRATARRERR